MSAILRNLSVQFGSLVDEPANKGARIMLFKRDDEAAAVAALTDAVAGVTKVGRKMAAPRMAALKVAIEHLNQILSECGAADAPDDQKEPDMAKKNDASATEQAAEVTPEAAPVVEKAAEVPADIAKRLADLEAQNVELKKQAADAAQVAKAERDARLEREYIAKAEKLNALSQDATKLGGILKRAADVLSAEDCAELDRVLAAANEAVGKSALFGEIGKSGADESASATDRLDKMASDLVIEKKAKNYAEAFTMVSADPANAPLVAAYQAERRAGN